MTASPTPCSALRGAGCLRCGVEVTLGRWHNMGSPCRPVVRVGRRVARHGGGEATECGTKEGRFRRTPTWRAKYRMLGSGRPLRFELWGAHEDLPRITPRSIASQESKLKRRTTRGHKIYTGSGHRCGVIPYSSVWCGGLPQGLMMNSTKDEQPCERCS